ncbi:hypothetical protein A2Y85_01605 [candidate division WOR-3 bacterium RBG_13_43_14]|uniref:Radical SAM core domain-containing protein n=1 Tax=candidate division WOR-3 bacterium RBG_13_43_14 TaxID=1802590 RepID=A0A1F4UDW5_UNCW3|nr:MAG: hypothetical protein A2Y85_01605 [candidate division WOR-3 bacterium RBG_13_43_14]
MLDDILPQVKKPIRYTGGEYNITIKSDRQIKVGIVFPEVYEIGMSNLGIKIIYHLFNKHEDIQCERIFAPWPDFGEALLQRGIPLYGLETQTAIKDFDLLGFSLQSELSYTNILYLFDLAGIAWRSVQRRTGDPLIIAGGPATLNPAPLTDVFDAFIIGDGEAAVDDIASILRSIPRSKKNDRLRELAKLPGVWAPSIHAGDHKVKRNYVHELSAQTLPDPSILPICEITHDRLAIEVMRGCTWGCRFCQAGYANRPLRIRSDQDILKAVENGIRRTGWEEISLLSFSILDYPGLPNLLNKLNEFLRKKMVSISLPAMRGELFTEDIGSLLKEIKKSGLTFAPETASDQLRKRLNKSFSNQQMIEAISTAYQLGWKQVKLYFMTGLPFEEDKDIDEIPKLINELLRAYPKGSVKLAISPFVPKPHTPFESADFQPIEILRGRIDRLKKMKQRRVEIKYQDPAVSFIEAVLSRGDHRLLPVLEYVYKHGGRFEEWREGFSFDRWQEAFQAQDIDPQDYLKRRDRYPWDFIDTGISKAFLRKEMEHARQGETTPNCFYEGCADCGICSGNPPRPEDITERYISYGRYPKRDQPPVNYRVKYSVGENYRYASHLDITRTIYRALRRTDLPLQFSQGYSPLPKVSFCAPKSVGQISRSDFFDFALEGDYLANISRELNARFPADIRILEVRCLPINTRSLSSSINLIFYEVEIERSEIKKPLEPPTTIIHIPSKSSMKQLNESLDSVDYAAGRLTVALYCGGSQLNIYEFLSYLTERSLEETKKFKVTRTTMFIKSNGILLSPMEVK